MKQSLLVIKFHNKIWRSYWNNLQTSEKTHIKINTSKIAAFDVVVVVANIIIIIVSIILVVGGGGGSSGGGFAVTVASFVQFGQISLEGKGHTDDRWSKPRISEEQKTQDKVATDGLMKRRMDNQIHSNCAWCHHGVTCFSSVLAATSLIAKELESPCSLKISFSSSTSVRGTGMTYQQNINIAFP